MSALSLHRRMGNQRRTGKPQSLRLKAATSGSERQPDGYPLAENTPRRLIQRFRVVIYVRVEWGNSHPACYQPESPRAQITQRPTQSASGRIPSYPMTTIALSLGPENM